MTRHLTCRKSVIRFRPIQAVELSLTGRVDNIVFQPNQHLDDGDNLQDAEPYEGQQPPQALVVHGRAPCWAPGGDDPFGDDDMDDDDEGDDDEDAPGGPEGPGGPRGPEVKMDFLLLMMGGL